MKRRLSMIAAIAASVAFASGAVADDKLKIGMITTLSGPPAVLGQQIETDSSSPSNSSAASWAVARWNCCAG